MTNWARRRKLWLLLLGGAAVVAGCLLGVVVRAHGDAGPHVDLRWMAEIIEHRSPFWAPLALFFNYAGGGIVGSVLVPLAIVVVLLALRRRWAALYFLAASVASVAVVQLLKALIGRARPLDMLVQSDPGSFPSGHTANAATMAVVLGLLVARAWVWAAGTAWVVLMAISRTYLGAHWLTDTVGGVLIGAGVPLLLYVLFGPALERERARVPARTRAPELRAR